MDNRSLGNRVVGSGTNKHMGTNCMLVTYYMDSKHVPPTCMAGLQKETGYQMSSRGS